MKTKNPRGCADRDLVYTIKRGGVLKNLPMKSCWTPSLEQHYCKDFKLSP